MREGVTIPNATARNKKLRVHVQHSRRFFQNALRQPNPAAQHRISLPGTTDQLEVIGYSTDVMAQAVSIGQIYSILPLFHGPQPLCLERLHRMHRQRSAYSRVLPPSSRKERTAA